MAMFKLQIVCMLIVLFISALYFSAHREKTKLHNSFARVLVALSIYLVFDTATVYTINTPSLVLTWINALAHRAFFISLSIVAMLFAVHVREIVLDETGYLSDKKQFDTIIGIVMAISVTWTLIAKPAYDLTNQGVNGMSNYATPSFSGGTFLAVIASIIMIGALLIRNRKALPYKKKFAIGLALVIELIGFLLQLFCTGMIMSGFSLTMMALAFYLTIENPDIYLLREIKLEKEKIEELSKSKSAFISVLSHEIRTPMNAIVGMSELMLGDSDKFDEVHVNYLKSIKNSGDSLIMIVNDVLDQAKIESGKMELIEDDYDIQKLLSDVKLIVENRAKDKSIEVLYDIDDKLPRFLYGDGLRIRQILINLMNNAVKYTNEGYVRLNVSVINDSFDKCLIRFAVEDSGQGIRPADLMRLGNAFTQVDVKENHYKEGTGLGLSISRDFISMMGSQLEVSSEYGKGSEFSFVVWQKVAESVD